MYLKNSEHSNPYIHYIIPLFKIKKQEITQKEKKPKKPNNEPFCKIVALCVRSDSVKIKL